MRWTAARRGAGSPRCASASVRASLRFGSESELDERELAVVQNFFDGGRLVTIPARRSKRLVVLRYLAEQFKPGRRYPEGEVNWILGRHHRDFAALRRYLVDEELMQRDRDGGSYWRAGSIPGVEWP